MKKFIAFAIAALTIVASTFGAKETVNGVEYKYSIENGQAAIKGESILGAAIPMSTSGELVIPSTLGGCPVTTIGSCAFLCRKSLTSITIHEGVTTIGPCAFGGCKKLRAINVAVENPNYQSIDGVLYSKEGGTILAVPGALASITIPEGVTTIGGYAFAGCKAIKSITIPKGVTTIWNAAFRGCESLTSITIPGSVMMIGEEAFGGCKALRDVYVENGCTERIRALLNGAGAKDDVVFHEIEPAAKASEGGWASRKKFCTECGTKLEQSFMFCPECGAKL